jgi:hypothetical protein
MATRRSSSARGSVAPFLFALLLAPRLSYGEIDAPPRLPLPRRVPDIVAGGPISVMDHPELFVTVGGQGCEYRSIGEALARPPDGRTRICVMDRVHRECGIRIEGEAEIYGFGAAATTIEGADGAENAGAHVIEVMPGSNVLLAGLTIRAGNNREGLRFGGGIVNRGSLVVEDCAVVENIATAGAGIWSSNRLEMRRSLVAANRVIHRPAAEESAGIGCRGSGGGMKIDATSSVLMEDCLVAWNASIKGGAGIHVSCETEARLSNCTVFGNSAGGRGAGIELAGGRLTLEGCTIAGNEGLDRGRALFNRGLLSITGCLLASEYGAAYFLARDGGGDVGTGTLVKNEGNFCQSGGLPGAGTGAPGRLVLADNGGPTWTALPEADSPARGYGAGSR